MCFSMSIDYIVLRCSIDRISFIESKDNMFRDLILFRIM